MEAAHACGDFDLLREAAAVEATIGGVDSVI